MVSLFHQQPTKILSHLQSILTAWKKVITAVEGDTAQPTWENTVVPFQNVDDELTVYWNRCHHFFQTENAPRWKQINTFGDREMTKLTTREQQSTRLLARREALLRTSGLSVVQRRALKRMIFCQYMAGAGLPPSKKRKLEKHFRSVANLRSVFSQRLLDATNAVVVDVTDVGELDGIPNDIIRVAKQRAKRQGFPGWRFSIRRAESGVVMRTATSRSLRERLYQQSIAVASELGPRSMSTASIILQLLRERQAMARLLGYPTYAHSRLADRMAKRPERATRLITRLAHRSKKAAAAEFQALSRYGARIGLSKLQPWDVDYVAERFRHERFSITAEALRQYFPMRAVLAGLAKTAERVFGVTMTISPWANGYRRGLMMASVRDRQGKRGEILLDLHGRPEKRGGAWMNQDRPRRVVRGKLHSGAAYIVCNLPAPDRNGETWLNHSEVAELFHEFGHALHHLLSDSLVAGVDGMNGVEWDVIELPSQWFEQFAWEPTVWDTFARSGAKKLPADLRKKLLASQRYMAAMRVLRQTQFALYDLRLYQQTKPTARVATTLWHQILRDYSVVPWSRTNRFPNSFSHIFSDGYYAGYYSYLWAEVLAIDAFAPLRGHPQHWAALGRRYRQEILAVGGSRTGEASFRALKGHGPDLGPLERHYGLRGR